MVRRVGYCSHRTPEPAFGPIRSRPIESERLDQIAEEGYRRGLKCDPYNTYQKYSAEWHRFEAAYHIGYLHMKEKNRGGKEEVSDYRHPEGGGGGEGPSERDGG